ncbi:TAXI family TRAP transporter solute-binding subunit [Oceanobacillus salinisoli]|uniref:TAXI family TRAP transporter solute-binding subunit n=1 Tax=Oceanobacillus salinisoli TaxID=2678611 RepID=UPI0012E2F5A3|nr:TAXI family TRAP transporter solute-binding subunit [Oceanobacillus salinisoli]
MRIHNLKDKVILSLFIVLLITLLGGCSEQSTSKDNDTSDESSQEGKPVDLLIPTMEPGTLPYVSSETLTPYFKEVLPEGSQIQRTPTSTGDISGIYLLKENQGDLYMVSDLPALWVWEGKPYPNIDGEYQGFRKLLQMDSYAGMGFLVSKDFAEKHNIETVDDLFEKDVKISLATYPSGSSSVIMFEQILMGYGFENLEEFRSQGHTVLQGGPQDLVKYMRDRQANVHFGLIVGHNFPPVEEMMTSVDLNLLPYGEEKMKQIQEEYQFPSFTVPKDSYKGIEEDTIILGLGNYVIVREDMPDDVAYQLTKAMYENWEEIREKDPFFSITPLHFRESVVPFHTGAEKYLKEVGALE